MTHWFLLNHWWATGSLSLLLTFSFLEIDCVLTLRCIQRQWLLCTTPDSWTKLNAYWTEDKALHWGMGSPPLPATHPPPKPEQQGSPLGKWGQPDGPLLPGLCCFFPLPREISYSTIHDFSTTCCQQIWDRNKVDQQFSLCYWISTRSWSQV